MAVTGLLITPTAAMAVTPLKAFITCDAETGAITTAASGNLLPAGTAPTRVTVEFQRRGTRVTATTSGPLTPLAQPFTTTATTTASGDIAATGYVGTFSPASSLYYQEQVTVTVKNPASGVTYATREATCAHDLRTTVSMTCDPVATTLTVTVAGINGQAGTSLGAGRPTRIGYRFSKISQSQKGDPVFRSDSFPWVWDLERPLTQAADGTWADPGFVHTPGRSDLNYYAEEVSVGIFDMSGTLVGGGAAKCTLINGPLTAAA